MTVKNTLHREENKKIDASLNYTITELFKRNASQEYSSGILEYNGSATLSMVATVSHGRQRLKTKEKLKSRR